MQICMMFEWDDARHFLAVHRARSLSAAARALGVNQSTVGRRLAAFEATLGARLFFRTPEGYVLAPSGECLLPRAERMESEAHAVLREVSGEEARHTGTVRITAPDGFGAFYLTPLLAEMHGALPEIDVELVADNRTLSLTKREADMAVRTGRPKEPSVLARKLCDFANALYAAPSYLAARGRPVPPNFAGHDFVGFDDPFSTTENDWVEQAARKGRIVFKSNSTPARAIATVAGMGLGLLPCYLGDADPRLVRVGTERPVVRNLWLVLHRDLQHSARIRACADFLVEAIAARAHEIAGMPPPRAISGPRPSGRKRSGRRS
jgi:DNA-binding transcriptional LysR family regulator